jgi:hypothetical protein
MVAKKEILEGLRKKVKFRDSGIFEKAVYAFKLLEGVLKDYPDLIFKGGTSILLHIFPPIRFSIDIDIILSPKDERLLEDNLKKVASEVGFNDVVEDIRKNEKGIPKNHFKFYYNSHYTRAKQYILLDIIFCRPPYSKLVKKSLSACPLSLGSSMEVRIPTIEGLFADKLTAIAPNTIGIPLNVKREMEFVKQVIDLGALFEYLDNIEDIRKTFKDTVKLENIFRKTQYPVREVIENILDASFKYCQYLLKGANNSYKEIEHINSGLKRVSNHLISKYTQSDLKIALSKIAYICRLIATTQKKISKAVDYKLIQGKSLSDKYQILESLKKTNPQGYFYWIQAFGR